MIEIILDASPLIYLAKMDAFDALQVAGHVAVVPPTVFAEAARPELAFRHPEIATIVRVHTDGRLLVEPLDTGERRLAIELGAQYAGMHAGELDVLALGRSRGWTTCFHERQAARLARALGVATVHLVELVFEGTPDADLLERRVRLFAQLTNMRLQDLDALLNLIGERR